MKFLSEQHKERFKEAITKNHCVSETGKVDVEYGVAFYLLTSSVGIWNKSKDYLEIGIDFSTILRRGKFSHGQVHIVRLAQNLFTAGRGKGISIHEMICDLDKDNLDICIEAMLIYKSGRITLDMLEEGSE